MPKRGRPSKWTEEEKEILELYKKQHLDKKTNKEVDGFIKVTRDEFIKWFKDSGYEKGCCYCGITNEMSKKIYNAQTISKIRIDATRGEKRMRRLELERKNPSEPYDNLKNLSWACHWCNNAKSNFFTEKEFHPRISGAIRIVLDEIINEINELSTKNMRNENI